MCKKDVLVTGACSHQWKSDGGWGGGGRYFEGPSLEDVSNFL